MQATLTANMKSVISGKIENGKIIPKAPLPAGTNNALVRIFILPAIIKKEKPKKSYFGLVKGVYGDALKYQKKIRKEWD